MDGGELFDHIIEHNGRGLPEQQARAWFHQLLTAIKYLHSQDVVHRDLKPENILVAGKGAGAVLKVSDFGLSRSLGNASVMRTVCG